MTSLYTGREICILDNDYREKANRIKTWYQITHCLNLVIFSSHQHITVNLLSSIWSNQAFCIIHKGHNQLNTEDFFTKLCNKECYHLILNFTTWCFLTGVDRTYVPKWTDSPPPFQQAFYVYAKVETQENLFYWG